MFEGKIIAVVMPCHNEQSQIGAACAGMPAMVDHIVIVDDASTDATVEVVVQLASTILSPRVHLVRRSVNGGPGAAVAAGFAQCLKLGVDVVAVMDGDGQMCPDDLAALVAPVARGKADYAKGNRLVFPEAWQNMPRHRYLGNALLSMLTKVASGYWKVADSQTGFIAISSATLKMLDLENLYHGYGYPNDLLVRLNVINRRVAEVPTRPIYLVGEQSKMRLHRVVPRISWLIVRRFCWRMWQKYVIRDFHPLVLFYAASGLLGAAGLVLFVRMIWMWLGVTNGHIPPINAMMWVFCQISSMQFGLFAMWFDMEVNRELMVRLEQ